MVVTYKTLEKRLKEIDFSDISEHDKENMYGFYVQELYKNLAEILGLKYKPPNIYFMKRTSRVMKRKYSYNIDYETLFVSKKHLRRIETPDEFIESVGGAITEYVNTKTIKPSLLDAVPYMVVHSLLDIFILFFINPLGAITLYTSGCLCSKLINLEKDRARKYITEMSKLTTLEKINPEAYEKKSLEYAEKYKESIEKHKKVKVNMDLIALIDLHEIQELNNEEKEKFLRILSEKPDKIIKRKKSLKEFLSTYHGK